MATTFRFSRASWSSSDPLNHPLNHPASFAVYLASRVIPHIIPMAHAILLGSTKAGQASAIERKANGLSPEYPEPLPQLDAATEAQVRAQLREIAAHLSFDVCAGEMALASCQPIPERPLPKLPGSASKIWINTSQYIAIERSFHSRDLAKFFYSLLELTISLIHEVAHAICFAVEPAEDVCEGNGFLGPEAACDEIGFEFESRLFGGVFGIQSARTASYYVNGCNCSRSELLGKAGFSEWPNAWIVNSYHARQDPVRTRRELSEEVVRWDVGLERVAEMFQESFWHCGSTRVDMQFPRLKRIWDDKSSEKVACESLCVENMDVDKVSDEDQDVDMVLEEIDGDSEDDDSDDEHLEHEEMEIEDLCYDSSEEEV
ncbi:hypothetical protein AC579_6431 [Pseudocercospora musae]|uniref:Uncharacterized protein n=1 Tax=Pseudocercospora musae TaxID=113226 RepID=A0A139I216_9PEZI|nr:hypothetical protein AC579_6431 [Pseudocercospora musae]